MRARHVSKGYIFQVNVSADTEWRWADPSGQQRLVRTDELRAALASGVVAPNTPVWRQGWKEWRPATDVPELTSSALSAANGVVPNIPPPPANVVAAQHAFEGEPGAKHDPSHAEPPPPPSYVPTPTRSQPGSLHTPSQQMKVPVGFGVNSAPAPQYSVSANTAVNIRAVNEEQADALVFAKPTPQIIELEPPTKRPSGEIEQLDSDLLKTLPHAVPSPAAPQVKSAPPPPEFGTASVPVPARRNATRRLGPTSAGAVERQPT